MTKEEYKTRTDTQKNTEEIHKYSEMIGKDQLTNQKELQMKFLQMFEEGPITFPPTYKIGNYRSIQGSTMENTRKKEYLVGLTESSIEREGD